MIHSLLLGLMALWALPVALCAQPLLEEVGGGVGLQGVAYLLSDDTGDRLLVTGAFTYANDVQVSPGILQWSASGLESIGCGVAWDCVSSTSQVGLGNRARSAAIWQDDVYVGGDFFFTRNGVLYDHIMHWDGSEWQPLDGGTDGPIKCVKVINDELIVAGWFTYADTVLANGLARWDGERWHRVLNVPEFYPGDQNYVQDVIKYHGEWYLGGNMGSVRNLVKWDGDSWEIVGGGFTGSFAQVNKLMVHDDKLYVAGSFAQCPPYGNPNNPGSGIVSWDGTSWDDLGGGTCGAPVGEIYSMVWWNEELYVVGRFNMIGGVPGDKLAKWNGVEWCTLTPPGYFGNGTSGALAVYHDSLYIGGAFVEAGGYEVSCFGKWIGGDETYACGALTGLAEDATTLRFSVFPNPTTDQLTLQGLPSSTTILQVRHVLGREVLRSGLPLTSFSVGHMSTGTYSLSALDRNGQVLATARFVRQ